MEEGFVPSGTGGVAKNLMTTAASPEIRLLAKIFTSAAPLLLLTANLLSGLLLLEGIQ